MAQQQEESSSVSSDWDDWQDPDYIEEQRAALQDFSKAQREIKAAHAKKKKKKGKKKKRGQTGGDALDNFDGEDVSESQFGTVQESQLDLQSQESYDRGSQGRPDQLEEEKVAQISKTPAEMDRSSIGNGGSNYD